MNKRENKDNVFKGFALIVAIVGIMMFAGWTDTHYTENAIVKSVDENGTVFRDYADNLWEVYDTNYYKGQHVRLYFFNNTTDYTDTDDIIIKIEPLN